MFLPARIFEEKKKTMLASQGGGGDILFAAVEIYMLCRNTGINRADSWLYFLRCFCQQGFLNI